MHIGEPHSCHAHTCIFLWRKNFHVIYLHLKGNFTSYIHLGSILVSFLTWVHFFWKTPYATYPQIYIFWKAFLHYLSYIYRFFFKCIIGHTFTLCKVFYALYSHTLQSISTLYTFTYIHTAERYFSCYLGARYSSRGSQI